MPHTISFFLCLIAFIGVHKLYFTSLHLKSGIWASTGLAGLRVGYGGFPLSLIEYLWRAKQPYNVSVAAEIAACAALTNPKYLEVVSSPRALNGLF